MTVLLAAFIALPIALVTASALAMQITFRRPALATFVAVSGLLGTVRLGALWFLTYLEWTHQQTLSALPLVFLMLPEALVFPAGHTLNASSAILFTLLLTAGSCATGGIVAGLQRIFRFVADRSVRDRV
jgi:hypothetical protein